MEKENLVYNIITLKVGNKYGAEYVNILYKYCKIFCSKKFNFVCFTEKNEDLHENIIVKEIPHKTWIEDDIAGWWLKLAIFQPGLFEENSMNLFLDLDNIICNQIDKFFDILLSENVNNNKKNDENKNKLNIVYSIKDWVWYNKLDGFKIFNTSAITWHGSNIKIKKVWNNFLKNKNEIYKNFKIEQDYFSYFMRENLEPYPNEWVVSFKECFQEKKEKFTQNTSIVVFHGYPKPHDIIKNEELMSKNPWIKNLWNPY